MRVSELIAELQKHPADAEVVFDDNRPYSYLWTIDAVSVHETGNGTEDIVTIIADHIFDLQDYLNSAERGMTKEGGHFIRQKPNGSWQFWAADVVKWFTVADGPLPGDIELPYESTKDEPEDGL